MHGEKYDAFILLDSERKKELTLLGSILLPKGR
jgi:hypothetical protein